MTILRIEHKVPDFEGWKKAFDNDPIDRKRSGVRRYRICRPANDPKYVIIELEFEKQDEAENCLVLLQDLWQKVGGKIMMDPQARILDLAEAIDL